MTKEDRNGRRDKPKLIHCGNQDERYIIRIQIPTDQGSEGTGVGLQKDLVRGTTDKCVNRVSFETVFCCASFGNFVVGGQK